MRFVFRYKFNLQGIAHILTGKIVGRVEEVMVRSVVLLDHEFDHMWILLGRRVIHGRG